MLLEWFVLLCLLSVPIHSAKIRHGNHSISTRSSADIAMENLSEDLFHFMTISVQLEVQDKLKQGPLDLQSLADRLSDLGVSFRKMDEAKVADLEDHLTAIGTAIESECSAGCAIPSEVTAGLGLIDTLKTKEAAVRAAFDVVDDVALGGNVVFLAGCLQQLDTFLKGSDLSDLKKSLGKAVKAAEGVDLTKAIPGGLQSHMEDVKNNIANVNSMLNKFAFCKQEADGLNDAAMDTQTNRLQKCNALTEISKNLIVESPKMVAFQQNSVAFAAKLEKIKTLIEQNQPNLVLAELKTLDNLNVGSKFLDYFDNSFIASKWLTKLLAGKEGQSLDKLKDKLKDVKSIGEQLDSLRTSVENVNSWDVHQALLGIESLLDKSAKLLPDLGASASEMSDCIKTFNLKDQFSINVQTAIDTLKNPQDHVSEFSQAVGAFPTDHAQSISKMGEFSKAYGESAANAAKIVQNAAEVTALQSSADALKTAFDNIKLEKTRKWLESTNIGQILANSKTWITKSEILTSLDCLKSKNSIDAINGKAAELQNIGKLGKSDANTATAIKAAGDLKAAIDFWKQLATPPARRRRRQAANTPIDEMIESTMALRRLLRACSRDALGVLARSAPQLDPTIKTTFENIGKACDELQATSEKVTKVTELAGMFAVLKPLADTNIDTVKLADQLASPSNPPDVQDALKDLKEIDLQFATYDSDQVDKALDGLETHFASLLGSRTRYQSEPIPRSGCVGDDCEEEKPFNWTLVLIILVSCIAILGFLTMPVAAFIIWREYRKANAAEKEGDEDKEKNGAKKDGKKSDKDKKKSKKSTDSKTSSKGEEKSEEPKVADAGNAPPDAQTQEPVKLAKIVVVDETAKVVEEPKKEEKKVVAKKKEKKWVTLEDPEAERMRGYKEALARKRERDDDNKFCHENYVDKGTVRLPVAFTMSMVTKGKEALARKQAEEAERGVEPVEFCPEKYWHLPIQVNRYIVGPRHDRIVQLNDDTETRTEKTKTVTLKDDTTKTEKTKTVTEKTTRTEPKTRSTGGIELLPSRWADTVWPGDDGWTPEELEEYGGIPDTRFDGFTEFDLEMLAGRDYIPRSESKSRFKFFSKFFK